MKERWKAEGELRVCEYTTVVDGVLVENPVMVELHEQKQVYSGRLGPVAHPCVNRLGGDTELQTGWSGDGEESC